MFGVSLMSHTGDNVKFISNEFEVGDEDLTHMTFFNANSLLKTMLSLIGGISSFIIKLSIPVITKPSMSSV